MAGDGEGLSITKTGTKSEQKQKTKIPHLFKVVLFNDHYTTMDFVVDILMTIFHKPLFEAEQIMLDIHRSGKGICGIYTYDIAISKVNEVHQTARQHQFPLKGGIEEV